MPISQHTATALLITACAALTLPAAASSEQTSVGQTADGFEFSPMPRWQIDPDERHELQNACVAIRVECGDKIDVDNFQMRFGYDKYYDVNGMLVGLHVTESTGCSPLDEHLLLGERRFTRNFRKPDQPDLADIRVTYPQGINPDHVRIVKTEHTNVSMGCY